MFYMRTWEGGWC